MNQRSKGWFARRYGLILLGFGCLIILTMVAGTYMLTDRFDQQTSEETRQRHALSLRESQASISLVLEDYAHWTVAYRNVVENDVAAIYDNIGSGAVESDLLDFVLILAPDGGLKHVFASINQEEPTTTTSIDGLATLLAALKLVDARERSVQTGYIGLGDSVAIVGLTKITPDRLDALDQRDLPILVGGRMLETAELEALAAISGARAIRVSKVPPPLGEAAMTLANSGDPLGWLAWQPPQPGAALRSTAMPWMIVVGVVALGALLVTGVQLRGLVRNLDQANRMATTDALTGLLNRSGLQEVLRDRQMKQGVFDGNVALVSVDLNSLKMLNDGHGHRAGDLALTVTARRLQQAVRPGDRVARLGGDEFLCLIPDQDPVSAATEIAERIARLCEEPIDFGEFHRVLKPSIGVASGAQGVEYATLLERSDAAMYRAKREELKGVASLDRSIGPIEVIGPLAARPQ